MNAVEIAEAVSELAAAPYVRADFPYRFLAAFGFKETTINKLKSGSANKSDVPDGVLLRGNIHLATADAGKAAETLAALKLSPQTIKGKAKFILATDGEMVEAEELSTGEPLSCNYTDIHDHFGFFLPLAGISTVAEIKDNPIDIRATGRLNKLYLELLKDNKEWATEKKRPALNQFMARLIFCFFAEDTGIFNHAGMFTECLKQMSEPSSSNTDEVIQELFRAMNTAPEARKVANLKIWAKEFPYVNGGLFADDIGCPSFSKIARSYLLRAGDLDWKEINPDIFGSMIQAVADDDERGSLGMHYTSVPNILKVLDPLFLDDLRRQLEEAEDNPRKLLNLRKRIANIRVFDPACGSGNFLVIAYQKMREIEAEIIKRRKDEDKKSWIKLTNFYGIEIKTFAAEIARLALLVSEFKANVTHIGQREACLDVLPLHATGKIVTGNALQIEWKTVCPKATSTNLVEEDLGGPTGKLALESEALVETYICGNPPYAGSKKQSKDQKADVARVLGPKLKKYKTLDYVAGWLVKAADLSAHQKAMFAFVTTNSICQGEQVALLWPYIFGLGHRITFAYRSFKWRNLAANNAGVTCVIAGIGNPAGRSISIYEDDTAREVRRIGPYLLEMNELVVKKRQSPVSELPTMQFGNHPYYGLDLAMSFEEGRHFAQLDSEAATWLRPMYGSQEYIDGLPRTCLWISDEDAQRAMEIAQIQRICVRVKERRKEVVDDPAAIKLADRPYRFRDQVMPHRHTIIIPRVSSEARPFFPFGLLDKRCVLQDQALAIYDGPSWAIALGCSRLHLMWIATVCGKFETRYRYSNTLGWNTFPVPKLTENDKADLTRCAEDILLARETHFPKTIADLYDPEKMPADLRECHDRNDETLERIYIGRRFKNDTERLEKLFDMYTKMTANSDKPDKKRRAN